VRKIECASKGGELKISGLERSDVWRKGLARETKEAEHQTALSNGSALSRV